MDDHLLKLTWNPPVNDAGIKSYEAWLEPTDKSSSSETPFNCTEDKNTSSCRFSKLESFQNYTVFLRSCNVSKDFQGPANSKLCSVEVKATSRTLHSGKRR